MKQEKFVPELRFPAFTMSWRKSKISEVLSIGSGKDYKHLTEGPVPVYGSGGIMTYVNKYLYEGESVCIGRKGTIDKPRFLSGKFWTVDTLFFTKDFKDVLPYFVFNQFSRINWYKYNEASGVPSLSKSTIYSISLILPSLPEQQKIADFLTAVDGKIQALTRKVDHLKAYKKGVMQKVFSGRWEIVDGVRTFVPPEIRFKIENTDGELVEPPDWEERKLGDVAIKSKEKNRDDSHSHVFTNSATQGIVNQREYFDKDIANQGNLEGYYVVKPDDLVYNPRISNNAPVGPMYRNKLGVTGLMSPLYSVFTIKKGNLEYLDYFFSSTMWHKYMRAVANYGARHDRMNVTNDDLMKLPILYPCLREQRQIANFLSSIDQKISAAEDQLDKMKEWKQGLLQKMFV